MSLVYGYSKHHRLNDLQAENQEMKAELQGFRKEIETLEFNNAAISKLASQLRAMLTIDSSDDYPGIGPLTAEEKKIMDSQPQRDVIKTQARLEHDLESIVGHLEHEQKFLNGLPTIQPVNEGYLSSDYGFRLSPFTHERQMHDGVDISTAVGTPVFATGGGKVIFVGYQGGYGKTIVIDHGFKLKTVYAHNSKLFVRKGAHVKRGELIATSGNTGRSTGPHLHYEVRRYNQPVDPFRYILN